MTSRTRHRGAVGRLAALAALVALALVGAPARAQNDLTTPLIIKDLQPKMVKIYGAGGFRGLEAYQSGFLISAEGHIATVWSYVLDTEYITVVLGDGRKFEGKLLGADPRLEVAVLKIEAQGLDHFDPQKAVPASGGTRVLAFSNLFGVAQGDEPVSVQRGVITAQTHLEARRGVFETSFRGSVYVIDAVTNNPGAAGGALTNRRGELVGMLGKELRNSLNNTWLNYAVPMAELNKAIDDIRAGKTPVRPAEVAAPKPEHPLSLELLGIVLVPDVLERTPPFVDAVRANSPAAQQGLRADDLVLFVNDRLIQSCKVLVDEVGRIDRDDKVKLTVIRDQQLVEVILAAPAAQPGDQ